MVKRLVIRLKDDGMNVFVRQITKAGKRNVGEQKVGVGREALSQAVKDVMTSLANETANEGG